MKMMPPVVALSTRFDIMPLGQIFHTHRDFPVDPSMHLVSNVLVTSAFRAGYVIFRICKSVTLFVCQLVCF